MEILSHEGNILENESAVQVICTSKQMSNEIEEKQIISEATEKQVDVSRLAYTPIASHSTILYFTIGMLYRILRFQI